MNLKIFEDSKNYTCQVIKLPPKQKVEGLDNLVKVTVFGNDCLIAKDSPEDVLYLFFPSECKISTQFLTANNLYRHNDYNLDKSKKGFFEDNGRVKAIKFRGVISSGFIIPLQDSLKFKLKDISAREIDSLKPGDEFNEIDGVEICRKYIKKFEKKSGMSNPKTRVIDEIVDSKFAPEHPDTSHLLKNTHKLNPEDIIAVTVKVHGTSARYYNTKVKRRLSWLEKTLKKLFKIAIVDEEFQYVTASRRVIKSVGFEELPNKNHYFTSGDLWSEVGKEFFEGKLLEGESVYCEIIGKTYTGEAIQHGYTYGLERPKVYIYRIAMINNQGIEIDLPYLQMKERALQLQVDTCPELFYGTLNQFTSGSIRDSRDISNSLEHIFNQYLEKPSILDYNTKFEEGFCLRVDKYPKPDIYKIKSKGFLLHEGVINDKDLKDLEEEQNATVDNL